MLQNFMWNAFEKTGNIDAYLFYKEMEKINCNGIISANNIQESIHDNTPTDT
ncbi:MAG: YqzL-like protein [Petroclostridium sp.]|jgi:hypothetical protein|uniref:YqzL family protein n=1 Tax=Petroclostridium xylanilyticum TaxID=1792311 RepID=UPI000B98F5F9|nr:YqzL family protein [Petroclostridium xylanilyticum]MBZ4644814.1 YqzL-like protein [Clostridia bacterium]MDK2811051.1 YqzL-like protein [Petroclostridium sp.]